MGQKDYQKLLRLPTILVVLGATGDLMATKIAPALFSLYQKGYIPKLFQIVGFARRNLLDDQFRDHLRQTLEKNSPSLNQAALDQFLDHVFYQAGNFEDEKSYQALARRLGHVDGQWRVCANKLFYLAVPPQHYQTIFTHLAHSGLTEPCSPEEGWTRVIVEKPFGKDLKTAQELDRLLGKLFREEQIYRIDHYLGKEMLQNTLAFRFSNNLFESVWNSRQIEKIECRFWETLDVGRRGEFYDGVGALRDVGQNHLLQMLALITMDHPGRLTAESVRLKRAEVLAALRIPAPAKTKRGQYRGFTDTAGVKEHSTTETFFKLETEINSPRWRNVPIILEGGKALKEERKEMVVTFRHPRPCLCPPQGHIQNTVTFNLEPKEQIAIQFWSKQPGLSLELEKRTFDFLYRQSRAAGAHVDAYQKLLLDCLVGDQLLFVSTEEIQAMWRLIDPIVRAWQEEKVPLMLYPKGSDPASALSRSELPKKPRLRQIGIIGLGKMGGNLVRHLLELDWQVIGYNRSVRETDQLLQEGLMATLSVPDLTKKLASPRVVWLMVPSGEPVDQVIDELIPNLARGDIIIDGGNSFFQDSIRRSRRLAKAGIDFLDVGVSGGPTGARSGAALMIGGKREVFERLEPLWADLAVPGGYQFFEGAGAGHFAKMIHNGIEYGMMQAIAEGFTILHKHKNKFDLSRVAEIYNNGSVIESRLIGWLKSAFEEFGPELKRVKGIVAHTGEGAWTVETAKQLGVPVPIIEGALEFRKLSEAQPSYTGKILSALRNQFGGHPISDKL